MSYGLDPVRYRPHSESTELSDKGLRVADLRRALEGLPDDAKVVLEGCDCSDLCGGHKLHTAKDGATEVWLVRVEHLWHWDWDSNTAERRDDDLL